MRTSGKVAYRKAQCLETLYLYRHLQSLDQVEDENVLSEKEIEILNLVRMQPSITQKEMANALDWNLASVKYYITKLKEKNYLKRQGSSQKGKWVILTKRD